MKLERCPMCGGRLISESIGWKCEMCNVFLDMNGSLHEHIERPFLPPMTNADRIRAMSDEELAEYLFEIGWDCHLCVEHERLENEPLFRSEKCDEKCVEHCLNWLQQPVEDE